MFRKTYLISLILFVVTLSGGIVRADVNNFVINDFSANYVLDNQDKQGRLSVNERIELTFNTNNHGILRAIPNSYNGKDLRLNIISVQYGNGSEVPYTTYQENDNTVLKIGDAGKTITGRHVYEIAYEVINVVNFYDGYDEFYWDINGDQWQQPFERVSVNLELPAALEVNQNGFECYSGTFGGTEMACTISQNGNIIRSETTGRLNPQQTLTIVAAFNDGYFEPVTWQESLRDNLGNLMVLILTPILFGGYAFRKWHKSGRDPAGKGTIVPQYEPPFYMRPAEVGVIADFKADHKDITATIIDLAVRRYIKIIEEKKVKKLRKDTLEYKLELIRTDWSKLNKYEITIITGIFGDAPEEGSIKSLAELKNKFYKSVASAQKELTESAVSEGYFASNPARAAGGLWVLLVVLFIMNMVGGGVFGGYMLLGTLLAAAVVIFFILHMPARTHKGVEAKDHALGLKLYIETAERDRIKMMQSPDAPYARNWSEPVKTVELFEKLLPYAIIFGAEKMWAKEFRNIYTEAPEWFSGNYTAFNAGYLAGALSGGMNSAMNTAFTAPSSSGSSGFGSGGFSGGGGGGGGGGGW